MSRQPTKLTRRLVLSGAVGFGAAAALNRSPVGAAKGWCRVDPLIAIDGDPADIFAAAPWEILWNVTGPIEFVVTVPKGVDARLILKGIGFGKGEKVSFTRSRRLKRRESGIEIKIKMRVPAKKRIPVIVDFSPRIVGILQPERAKGVTNEWVTLKTIF